MSDSSEHTSLQFQNGLHPDKSQDSTASFLVLGFEKSGISISFLRRELMLWPSNHKLSYTILAIPQLAAMAGLVFTPGESFHNLVPTP